MSKAFAYAVVLRRERSSRWLTGHYSLRAAQQKLRLLKRHYAVFGGARLCICRVVVEQGHQLVGEEVKEGEA